MSGAQIHKQREHERKLAERQDQERQDAESLVTKLHVQRETLMQIYSGRKDRPRTFTAEFDLFINEDD